MKWTECSKLETHLKDWKTLSFMWILVYKNVYINLKYGL